MEMKDQKGYDKKTTWGEDVFVIIFIIVYSVIIVLVCMMDDVSLIMKLLCVTFMLWYIYTYLGSKTFCLFNCSVVSGENLYFTEVVFSSNTSRLVTASKFPVLKLPTFIFPDV
mgnify:CR=1 FL=1